MFFSSNPFLAEIFWGNLRIFQHFLLFLNIGMAQVVGILPRGRQGSAPGRSKCDSKNVILNLVLLIGIFRSSHDNALSWMPQHFTDDKSTCLTAPSHYLSQCWISPLSPYGVARPHWVNTQTIPILLLAWWRWQPRHQAGHGIGIVFSECSRLSTTRINYLLNR